MTLGEALNSRGLRQMWLADQLGAKRSHVAAVCLGRQRIPAAWMPHLAAYLGVELADIVEMQAQWEAKRGEKGKGRGRGGRDQKRAA